MIETASPDGLNKTRHLLKASAHSLGGRATIRHAGPAPLCYVILAFALGGLGVGAAHASHATRQPAVTFRLINATYTSITALAIAPAGGDDFHAVTMDKPLQGGVTGLTFAIPAGGCLRDLRMTFRDGRVKHLDPLDVCRVHAIRLDAH